ncbi:MAG: nuclear transport factor 2 family protein [Fimbriimonadaceae bacterium]|nr:nuclear transport factor 2 family protein [Alphaproteobacteria bacterium]
MTENREETSVLAVNTAFYVAISSRDVEKMEQLWADNGEIAVLHPGWPMLEGRDKVMESWQGILANPDALDIEFGNGTVEFTDDEAVVKGSEFLEAHVTKVVNVFRKQTDGRWLMVFHGAETINMPAPGHA